LPAPEGPVSRLAPDIPGKPGRSRP